MSIAVWLGLVGYAASWLFVLPIYGRTGPAFASSVLVGCAIVFLASLAVKARRASAAWNGVLTLATTTAMLACATPLLYWLGSRVHEIHGLAAPLAALYRSLGYDAFVGDHWVHVRSGAHLVPFSINTEKLAAIPMIWVVLAAMTFIVGTRAPRPARACAIVTLSALSYAALRFVALSLIVLESEDPRNLAPIGASALDPFSLPLWQVVSLLPFALVLAALLPWRKEWLALPSLRSVPKLRAACASVLATLFAIGLVGGFQYQDPGVRKDGRVLFDEVHSPNWEVASKTFDRSWYGRDSVYNYATFAEFLGRYYDVDLNSIAPYSDDLLADYDILVLKTPTVPFDPEEVDSIRRFVEDGGGLFLIGDHTNLLGMSDNLNAVASEFGFEFELDASNRLDDGAFQSFTAPLGLSHPASARVRDLEFMTACTISAPLFSENVMVVSNTFSDPSDYSSHSFFGNVIPDTEDNFGLHVLSTARKFGRGRVLAFADSTVFSNFGVMFSGRPEFILGTMDYLNRRNTTGYAWNRFYFVLAAAAALLALFLTRSAGMRFWLAFGAPFLLLLGLVSAAAGFSAQNRSGYPEPKPVRPMSTVAFLSGDYDYFLPPAIVKPHVSTLKSFDTFFVWTQRLGRFPRVHPFDRALENTDVVVSVNSFAEHSRDELDRLVEFVRAGGRLLVLDSIWNPESTSNDLLRPFGIELVSGEVAASNRYADESWLQRFLEMYPHAPRPEADAETGLPRLTFGEVVTTPIHQEIPLPTLRLVGGTALFQSDEGVTYAVVKEFGKGRVVAVVDSVLFSRAYMGETTDEPPLDASRVGLYELEYQLFEEVIFGEQSNDNQR